MYFGECTAPTMVVTLQIFVSIFVDAVFIGLIFLRFSRPHKRAQALLFSEVGGKGGREGGRAGVARTESCTAVNVHREKSKASQQPTPCLTFTTTHPPSLTTQVAVIRPASQEESRALAPTAPSPPSLPPSPYVFSLRVAELTRYELISPRVRLYAIRHSSPPLSLLPSSSPSTTPSSRLFFQTYSLPLLLPSHPSSLLLMTLPATVAVALLPSSPLIPPQWEEGNEEQLAAFWREVEMEVLVLIEGEGGREGGREGRVWRLST